MEIPQDLNALSAIVSKLATHLESLQVENAALKAANEALRLENEDLRRRLGLKVTIAANRPRLMVWEKNQHFLVKAVPKRGGNSVIRDII
jgi:regulator of replication initiation timing